MYEVKEPFWQFIGYWQTLIAGVLALVAGAGTVWATIISANREIAVAQEQTKAAQRQTEVTREIERRRIARERYAFYAMLEAAMGAVTRTSKRRWNRGRTCRQQIPIRPRHSRQGSASSGRALRSFAARSSASADH
jgi:hypothetical protein